jgi:hypothetical protein
MPTERLPEVGRHLGWNEEHFVTVEEFRQNAPAVVKLEINRLTGVLESLDFGSNTYNEIVFTRHLLMKVTTEIDSSTGVYLQPNILVLLESAMLRMSAETNSCESDLAAVLEYTMNRLDYLITKMRRLA